jgi:hypothetical protein
MTVFRKHLPRRQVLRGAGAALALPLLDSMVPAFTPTRLSAAAPTKRLGLFYVPMGVFVQKWTPPAEGALTLSPILTPLKAFQDRAIVISGLDHQAADSKSGGGPHSRCQTAWLSGATAKRTEGADLHAGTTLDQLVAKSVGGATELPSLEVALETLDLVGACDSGYACTYTSTLSWKSPTQPLPMEGQPRALFERLFGASRSTDAVTRRAYLAKNRSILDSLDREIASLSRSLGAADRQRLGGYLESVRDAEQRIQKAESQLSSTLPVVDRPSGFPGSYEEYARLMLDLIALAYQIDKTRVASFMFGRELSLRTFPEIGVPDPHHPTSHHSNDPVKLEKQAKINIFHLQLFTRFLEKMQATPDGDGSLLDHSLFLYGSGMSNSDQHSPYDLPLVLFPGSLSGIRGGRHLRFKQGTPVTNLHLTILEQMGSRMEQLGDSNGELNLLTAL